jgi:hypothetical protein
MSTYDLKEKYFKFAGNEDNRIRYDSITSSAYGSGTISTRGFAPVNTILYESNFLEVNG